MADEADDVVIELNPGEGGYQWLNAALGSDEEAVKLNDAFRACVEATNSKLTFEGGLAAITATLLSSLMAGSLMGKDPYRGMAKVHSAFGDMMTHLENMKAQAEQETLQ